jgi:hypothetical protein
MEEQAFIDRVAELLEQERTQSLQWFYVSFADESGFKGAVIVEARGITSAVLRCNVLGVNPHGQAMGLAIGDWPSHLSIDIRDRLLTKDELNKIFPDMKTLGELESEGR